jgi:hypothetical protein
MNLVGMLSLDELFKGRHFDREIIVLAVVQRSEARHI